MLKTITKRGLFTLCALLTIGVLFYFHQSRRFISLRFIETKSIEDVLKYADGKDTLVVFDIDNTLAYPKQELGSDPWVSQVIRKKTAAGMDIDSAYKQFLPLYYHVHDFIDMYPVEEKTLETLNQLKERGIQFIALTSRSMPFIARTHEQMEKAGIFFNPPAALTNRMQIKNAERPAVLSNGIIFCTDNSKGEMLAATFEQLGIPLPKKIVYVDDKRKYLDDVATLCKKEGIEFIGLRYGNLDQFVNTFDMKKAENQLQEMLAQHPFDLPQTQLALGAA